MLVIPNVGEVPVLDALTTAWNAMPTTLHLYQNDVTPNAATVLADLTECDFSGYAADDLDTWAAAALVAGKAQSVADLYTFTHDGGATPNDIYGYYVLDGAGALLFAERDPNGPTTISAAGQEFNVLPRFTFRSES